MKLPNDTDAAGTSAPAAADAASAPVQTTITLTDIKNAAKAALAEREQEIADAARSALATVESDAVTAWAWIRDKGRAAPLLVLFVIAFAVVYTMNPAKAGLALWGVCRVCLFAYLAYWVDRIIFGRLKGLSGIELGTAWKRRAFIVGCALIAGALLP